MKLDKRHTNTFWSFIIILGWIGLVFLIGYPSYDAPTDDFGVIIYCILTLFMGLLTGVIVLFIRFLKPIKGKSNFSYNFAGMLNTCLGILGLTLASLNGMDRPWIILFIISFIIGIFILLDIYIKRSEAPNGIN